MTTYRAWAITLVTKCNITISVINSNSTASFAWSIFAIFNIKRKHFKTIQNNKTQF